MKSAIGPFCFVSELLCFAVLICIFKIDLGFVGGIFQIVFTMNVGRRCLSANSVPVCKFFACTVSHDMDNPKRLEEGVLPLMVV